MELGLLFILLLSHYAYAVVNKNPELQEGTENKEDLQAAEDRISSSYGPPNNNNVNNPAPVYGPPEISNDYRLPQIYAPPPPEQPPPISQSYNAPRRKPTGTYGPPKPSYGPPPVGPPKSTYGPPKGRYGPPKRSSFPPSSLRPPKPKYGPPFNSGPNFNTGNYPSIPLSIEEYGPPVPNVVPSFNVPQKEYGPPQSQKGLPPAPSNQYGISHAPSNQYGPPPTPSNQYGPPSNQYGSPPPTNHYGPPPASSQNQYRPSAPHSQYGPPLQQQFIPPLPSIPAPPPPGVPAPPTPPDIKYDGWQPITGSIDISKNPIVANTYGQPEINQRPPLANAYGPPELNQGSSTSSNYGPPETNAPVPPSDNYGLPKNQLQPSNNYGPPAQSYEPPVDNYGPPANSFGSQSNSVDQQPPSTSQLLNFVTSNNGKSNVVSDSYGVPINNQEAKNLKSSSQTASLDSQNGLPPPPLPQLEPLHGGKGPGDSNIESHETYGTPNELSQKPELPSAESFFGSNSGSAGQQNNLVLQIPHFSPQQSFSPPAPSRPFNTYGPPVSQNYGPPLSSPSSQNFGNRGISGGSFFNTGSIFNKVNNFLGKSIRQQSQSTPPATLIEHFVPPRPRPPIKFRESVPNSVFSSINRYIPPAQNNNFGKLQKNIGPYKEPSREPELPSLSPPVNFHNSVPNNNAPKVENHNNAGSFALAAPNINYGTPLSFSNFNTPATLLTYGAPNFGPVPFVPDSLNIQGNLYNNIRTGLPNIYGTPIINGQNSLGLGQNCNFLDNDNHLNSGLPGHLDQNNIVTDQQNALYQSSENSVELYKAPSVNELDLENHEQQKSNLKDSYGNPIGIAFDDSDHASANLHGAASSSQEQSASSYVNSISNNILAADLNSKGYSEAKHFNSDIEAMQFLNSQEGHQALALAQSSDGSDGFQIQGSRGVYTLQIQPADGGFGTENSDGTIRHDQVLSNGLLQDIIAAIEQPQGDGHIKLQGLEQNQSIEQGYSTDLHLASSSAAVSNEHSNYRTQVKKDVDRQTGDASADASNNKTVQTLNKDKIALFVNSDYSDNIDASSNKPSTISKRSE